MILGCDCRVWREVKGVACLRFFAMAAGLTLCRYVQCVEAVLVARIAMLDLEIRGCTFAAHDAGLGGLDCQ